MNASATTQFSITLTHPAVPNPWIEKLDKAVIQTAENRPLAVCLMQQAGVGPVTALAFVLTIGPVSRFANSKKVVSYEDRIHGWWAKSIVGFERIRALVETRTRILNLTPYLIRMQGWLQVCPKPHQEAVDNADDVIHGT